jgi:hypothetical protein
MSSGLALFQRAEIFYAEGKVQEAFNFYQKSVKKILKDENITAILPAIVPDHFPQETLGAVWRNFVCFFRDPAMSFTEKSDPEAYKLLTSFKPTTSKSHSRMERTPRGKILLKGMQIAAGQTLGLMAWDKRDRATAAKRYREALDLAATYTPFIIPSPGTVGLEKWICLDVEEMRDNLALLVVNDTLHAQVMGGTADRKDIINTPHVRIHKTGEATLEKSVMISTVGCAACGKRDVKLMRCSLCKKTPCECS